MNLEMPTIDGPSMLKFIRQEGYAVPVIIVLASITDQTPASDSRKERVLHRGR